MACNPVVQYNDFVGDGVTVDFTFTFPYIDKTEVMVRAGEYPDYTFPVYTTEYYVNDANPTVVTFVNAPTGPFRIFRCTDASVLPATFQAGSAIRASDLNANFEQTLFLVQDANVRSNIAQDSADNAFDIANDALDTANDAKEIAEDAKEIAEDAKDIAQNALDLVGDQVAGEVVQTIPELPVTPATGAVYTVINSTGVESLTPLELLPDGFVGSSDISVKLQWNGSSWIFLQAYVVDPDVRYIRTDWSIYPVLP